MEYIKNHYSDTRLRRTPEAVEKEKTIGLGPLSMPYNRWLMFPAAFIFQAICGSLYAWSVFNDPIDIAIYGLKNPGDPDSKEPLKRNAPITFYLAVGFFGLSAAINGPWLERVGPRKAALIGTTFFFIGNLVAAAGIRYKIMGLVYFGYGFLGGGGLGLCYISPVSSLQKWFPDRRGLAAGFAVCGFGAGSIVLAKVPLPLAAAIGLTNCFVTLGCCYFGIMFICSLIFRVPPPGFVVNGMDIYRNKVDENGDIEAFNAEKSENKIVDPATTLTLDQAITSTDYRIIYLMFFGNSIAGLVFLSRLSTIVQKVFMKDPNVASTVVSINGGFNLFGRLFFSTVSDRLGRKNSYVVMLVCQVVILAALPTIMEKQSYPAFVAVIWILTACYGGGFGCIPAFLCDMFGPTNIGALHGIILTAWSIAGVGGGLIFTAVYNNLISDGYTAADVHVYAINLYWILGVACFGFLMVLFVRTSLRDRLLPKAAGELTRVRIFGYLMRVGSFGFQFVSKSQEDAEWAAFVDSRCSPDTLRDVTPQVGAYDQKAEVDEQGHVRS